MKKQLASTIGWLLLLIAFGVYVYGIYFAIFDPLPGTEKNPPSIPEPLDSIVATISAILLTNLGAVLGIAVAKPASGLGRLTLIGKHIDVPDPITKRELIQYSAVVLYLVVLVACFISWACHTFVATGAQRPVTAIVVQNGKTLFGVMAAYLAFVLGTNSGTNTDK